MDNIYIHLPNLRIVVFEIGVLLKYFHSGDPPNTTTSVSPGAKLVAVVE